MNPFDKIVDELFSALEILKAQKIPFNVAKTDLTDLVEMKNKHIIKSGLYPPAFSDEWAWYDLKDKMPQSGRDIVFQHRPPRGDEEHSSWGELPLVSYIGMARVYYETGLGISKEDYDRYGMGKCRWRYYSEGKCER